MKRIVLAGCCILLCLAAVPGAHADSEAAAGIDASATPEVPREQTEGNEVPPDSRQDADLADRDPTVKALRFADRRQVVFRLGLGGNFNDALFGKRGAKPTYGVTLRWDRPVHEYVTTGLAFSFYSARADGDRFREPGFDVDLVLKGRYPFRIGRKKRQFESEVYLLWQVGLTIWIDSGAVDFNLIGPGWNTGLAPGYQFFINDRVGLLAEVGWLRTEAFFARGRLSLVLNQAVIRIGAVFPF